MSRLIDADTFLGKTSWAKRKYQKVIAWMPLPEYHIAEAKKKVGGTE